MLSTPLLVWKPHVVKACETVQKRTLHGAMQLFSVATATTVPQGGLALVTASAAFLTGRNVASQRKSLLTASRGRAGLLLLGHRFFPSPGATGHTSHKPRATPTRSSPSMSQHHEASLALQRHARQLHGTVLPASSLRARSRSSAASGRQSSAGQARRKNADGGWTSRQSL